MGQVLTVILDILGARELVDPRKILTGYKTYWQIIQEGLAVVDIYLLFQTRWFNTSLRIEK